MLETSVSVTDRQRTPRVEDESPVTEYIKSVTDVPYVKIIGGVKCLIL